jgi:hypothetical protein
MTDQELLLDPLEGWLARWAELMRPSQKELEARESALKTAALLGFPGIGIQTAHITAAPDVVEALRRLPQIGGVADEGGVLPPGTPILHGLPIFEAFALPRGYWMRWQGGRPVDVGKIKEEAEMRGAVPSEVTPYRESAG